MALRRTLVVTQFYGRIKGRHLHNRIHRCVCRHNIRYQNLSIAQWTPFVFLIQLYHGTNIFYRTGFVLYFRDNYRIKLVGLFYIVTTLSCTICLTVFGCLLNNSCDIGTILACASDFILMHFPFPLTYTFLSHL